MIGTVLALPYALNLALGNSLGRDEHQHLAAGIVMLREGWLPYRDYAFFHLPYLAWTYGGLFSFGGDPLMISRLFSAACVALTVGLVTAAAWRCWSDKGAKAWLAAIAAFGIVLTTPLFAQVAGHSWNLEPSTLFLLAAFVALLERGGPWRWIIAGLATGIAAGYRVTVLPMVLPLMIMAWSHTRSWRSLAIYSAGIIVAMLPIAITLLLHPEGFVFGNVEFPKINIDYRFATGEPRTMTLPTKLRFFFKEVMRPNWPLLIAFPALFMLAWSWLKARFPSSPTIKWTLLAIPFLMLGGFAPSPAFDQYYYPLIPFVTILLIAATRTMPEGRPSRILLGTGAVLFLGFALFSLDEYEDFRRMINSDKWAVTETRESAADLRTQVGGNGRILTSAPALALEAGFEIYPEFVTGPFAWRVGPFVEAPRRAELHLTDPEALHTLLTKHPPCAILTGYARKEEQPIVEYAEAHGYRKKKFAKGKTLWLPQPHPLPVPQP